MKNRNFDYNIILTFIRAYRKMEGLTPKESSLILKKILEPNQVKHLTDSWISRSNDFGSFYLNLSHYNQSKFLTEWNIDIPGLSNFYNDLDKHPAAYIYTEPPSEILTLHYLQLYFNNHSIESINEIDVPGQSSLRFGNSTNWGNYILSLNHHDQCKILDHISYFILDNIEKSEHNRSFFRKQFN